ncbi:MAG: hypothetical protein R3A51_23495 [Nannocystaceae bacterium]|nr:hypothetical protein [Myxococcales bacterium]
MYEQTVILGASTNAVVAALLNRDALLADFPRKDELAGLEDREYYPLAIYLELCDYLEQRLGMYAFLRVGRRMAIAVMDTAFPPTLQTIEEAVAEIHAAHQLFCKPTVGAFEIAASAPGRIAVRYTAPYNCILQEGLFYEVALRYGASDATVAHAECRRRGHDACRFEIRY